jgi:hypothetical protein
LRLAWRGHSPPGAPTIRTDIGQTEGHANATNPTGGDPVSTNTDGRWVTPNGRLTLHIGSSVQDIRLTDTVTLRGGTCRQASDAEGAGNSSGGGSAGGGGGGQGPAGPAGRVVCRNTTAAQVLCTLLFEDGTWETAPAAARTARLRLVKGGRTFASGRAALRSGRVRARLRSTRTARPGSYTLRLRVRGETMSVKVKLRSARGRV